MKPHAVDPKFRHPRRDRSLFDTAWTLQIIRALAISVLLAASAPIAAWWFGEPRLVAVVLIVASVAAVTGFANIGVVEFQRDMRFDRVWDTLREEPRLQAIAASLRFPGRSTDETRVLAS